MRVYLDACALNRPFDDQSQLRVRLEAEAVRVVLEMFRRGDHEWVGGDVLNHETSRMPDAERRAAILELLTHVQHQATVTENVEKKARLYHAQGVGVFDALHLAQAEDFGCDVLLTTDDNFVNRSRKLTPASSTRVVNAAAWVAEETQR